MERILDVSDLEPCEPMERTLQAVGDLGEGEYLCLIHRREPHLLYPVLDKMGFAWRTRPGGASQFEIFIWKRIDRAAGSAVALRTD
jgi:uncharacterized protein (DUF2249 family)